MTTFNTRFCEQANNIASSVLLEKLNNEDLCAQSLIESCENDYGIKIRPFHFYGRTSYRVYVYQRLRHGGFWRNLPQKLRTKNEALCYGLESIGIAYEVLSEMYDEPDRLCIEHEQKSSLKQNEEKSYEELSRGAE